MALGFLTRGLIQVLAAHAIVSTMVALGVLLAARHVTTRSPLPAVDHARRLFALRLAPSIAALVVAWLGVPMSFALWEPRIEAEHVGPVAMAAAGLGMALVASGAWRAVVALWQTRRIQRDLRSATWASLPTLPVPAFIVETTFPVVALVGMVASRLFVARTVVRACTDDEFRTVIGHELAHASAHDNLRRLAMASAPDVLAWMRAGARLEHAWALAAELAADESGRPWLGRPPAPGLGPGQGGEAGRPPGRSPAGQCFLRWRAHRRARAETRRCARSGRSLRNIAVAPARGPRRARGDRPLLADRGPCRGRSAAAPGRIVAAPASSRAKRGPSRARARILPHPSGPLL